MKIKRSVNKITLAIVMVLFIGVNLSLIDSTEEAFGSNNRRLQGGGGGSGSPADWKKTLQDLCRC